MRNVEAGYGAVRVLHGVSIEVREGETVALLGANGNGKSTLLKCIMGMVAPESGEIFLETDDGQIDLTQKTTEEIVSLGIALVPEGRRLFPKLTVEENLLLGAYRPEARAGIPTNLAFCFETFPVLHVRRRQLAGSMSGGEQQMLAVARALMSSPRILLVDEPSVGLAPILVSRVIAKIKELKERYQLTARGHEGRAVLRHHARPRPVGGGDPCSRRPPSTPPPASASRCIGRAPVIAP